MLKRKIHLLFDEDICPRCGSKLKDGFCMTCGWPLNQHRVLRSAV